MSGLAAHRRQRVLMVLEDNGTLSAKEIARLTGMSAGRVNGALRVLEGRFQVQRDSIRQDRKGAVWSLSELGRRQLA